MGNGTQPRTASSPAKGGGREVIRLAVGLLTGYLTSRGVPPEVATEVGAVVALAVPVLLAYLGKTLRNLGVKSVPV